MINELLKAEGEKLSQLLGKLLQPEKNRHNLWIPDALWGGNGYQNYECQRCDLKKGLSLEEKEQWLTDNPCPIPCPIPLTPDNAFKWRDWAVAEYGKDDEGDTYFVKAMMDIYNLCGDKYGITAWLTDKAQPRHYLIAAAKCKENSNEESR